MKLRGRAGFRDDGGTTLVPPWFPTIFLVSAVVLVPWTALVIASLPDHYKANHWSMAWTGFDIGLGLALAATAVAVLRRSTFAELAATVSGTLLVCDAWFDVMTSRGTKDVAQAVASALLVELPLAGLCFWVARNIARALEVVRPFLLEAGFRVEGRKLVPPPTSDDAVPEPVAGVETRSAS